MRHMESRRVASLGRLLGSSAVLLSLVAALWACSSPAPYVDTYVPPPLPRSHWNGNYAYNFPTPSKSAQTYDVNIAVVDASYRNESGEDTVFAQKLYAKIGKGLSASMGADADKLLIAKGLTTTGPYETVEDITYDEKKQSALTLVPHIYITIDVKLDNAWQYIRDGQTVMEDGNTVYFRAQRGFTMNTSGIVTFVMQEPLSTEKMWIKKLELDPIEVHGIEVYAANGDYGSFTPSNIILYDGKVDALADTLRSMYPIIMTKFNNFLDPIEMMDLKKKSQEIRARKVY